MKGHQPPETPEVIPSQPNTKIESPHLCLELTEGRLPNIEVGGEGNDDALRTFSEIGGAKCAYAVTRPTNTKDQRGQAF